MKKRILSLFTALAMTFTFIPPFTFTAIAATDGDWTYTVSGGNATITGYTGAGGVYQFPK